MKHLKKYKIFESEDNLTPDEEEYFKSKDWKDKESELMGMFSEKGWNLVNKEVFFTHRYPNRALAGRSGFIRKVKDNVAYIAFSDNNQNDERMEIPVPFSQFYKNPEVEI